MVWPVNSPCHKVAPSDVGAHLPVVHSAFGLNQCHLQPLSQRLEDQQGVRRHPYPARLGKFYVLGTTANRKFAEKSFSSSHDLPHCKLTVDAEERSRPKAKIRDEATPKFFTNTCFFISVYVTVDILWLAVRKRVKLDFRGCLFKLWIFVNQRGVELFRCRQHPGIGQREPIHALDSSG